MDPSKYFESEFHTHTTTPHPPGLLFSVITSYIFSLCYLSVWCAVNTKYATGVTLLNYSHGRERKIHPWPPLILFLPSPPL
jgi:hypothetical protein